MLAMIALIGSLTGGCATKQYTTPEEAIANACSALGPKSTQGALIGAAAGAAGGAAIGAAAGGGRGAGIGVLVGLGAGLISGAIAGNVMDKRDCQEAQIALQRMNNAPTDVVILWSDSTTGSHGSYTPITDAYNNNGRLCRQVRADYYMKNHQPVYGDTGLVCRTSSGDWARVAS
jgi:surface antigen